MKTQWQQDLISSIRDLETLCRYLHIDTGEFQGKFSLSPTFPVNVPLPFAEKIQKRNLDDPLLLQVLPRVQETFFHAEFTTDPVGDSKAKQPSGLIHKYKNRVLMTVSGNCAIHCRYCFRQHFPYEETSFNQSRFEPMMAYIKSHPEIDELILSGGDPLSVNDAQLSHIFQSVDALAQIETVRIHTRFPVVIPSRLTDSFMNAFQCFTGNKLMVFHINHPAEIDQTFLSSIQGLKQHGVQLLNQAVLLKDVNDSYKVLSALSKKLVSYGITPYYLNQLDKVQGATHFEVPKAKGLKLIQELRENMSGYMVPRYIQEIAGEKSKTVLK